ncbi:hypothetical protein HYC85_019120 [Camellia sinensis]|uniref:PWWP domain-containing protein n=1 Tax=Camellia sinensis TaxID=4442 RepID=A0A7J7GPZ3_CAMSI|nr:hypothetical protein HYC85_019120 [Camellia sinensis]
MGSEETRNSSEHSSMDMYSRLKPRASNGNSAAKNVKSMNEQCKKSRVCDGKKKEGIDYRSKSNTLDEGTEVEKLDALKDSGYEVGDMVWGKAKSHPWWPGQIFDEALASPSICRREKEGQVLVAFYGDDTYGWFEPGRLIPFDFHYTEKSKQTNTPEFLTAVGEAVDEVKRRAALGLTCHCRKPNIFRPKSVEGFFEVDVSGFQPGGLYSMKQIERARDAFQPSKTLSFVKQLTLMPQDDVQRNVEWTNNVALVLAYRRAVFEEFDETYAQAFGVQPVRPGVSAVGLLNPEKAPLQELNESTREITGAVASEPQLNTSGFAPLNFPMRSVEQKMAVQTDIEANQYTLKSCVETMTAVTNLSNRLQSRANEVQQLNSQLALLQRMYKDARAEISVLKAENKELKRKATVMFRFGGPPYAAVEEYGGVIVPSGVGNTEATPSRAAQDGGKKKRPAAE